MTRINPRKNAPSSAQTTSFASAAAPAPASAGRAKSRWAERHRLSASLLAAVVLTAGGSLAACSSDGGTGTTGTTGSGGSGGSGGGGGGGAGGGTQPQAYAPKGCGFTIAPRAEYKDFTVGKSDVGASPNIRRVRLGLGGNVAVGAAGRADPSTSIGAAWQTDDGTLASEIQWGKDPDPAKWPAENRAQGATWLTPQGIINSGQGDQRMHEVHVCGLDPDTTYYYRVGGGPAGSEVWSDVYHFATTPSDPSATVTFGVAGDARGEKGGAWRLIQKRMMLAGVGVQLFSGDVVNLAQDQDAWEAWLDSGWKDEEGKPLGLAQILTLATHGNHENHTTLFYGSFVLPQDDVKYPQYSELFYSVDVGPTHVVVIDDSWVAYPDEDPEYKAAITQWLEADLAAANANRAKVPWIITLQHRSEFSSSSHGEDADVLRTREHLMPIWDEHHVDLAIRGHDHNYERSKPITGPADKPTIHADAKDGTVYVVCAGAGAPAYSNGMSEFTEMSWGFKAQGSLGVYGILTASPTSLKFDAHELRADASDPVVDTFTFTK